MYADSGVMVEFGQDLRRAREHRGVPLDAVCAITKVSARHLEALEAGHLEELPGGVFRKGIVRSYLDAVGLEEGPWMERFDSSLRAAGERTGGTADEGHAEWAEFAENVKRNRAAPGPPTGMRWLGVVLMFLVLLLCGYLAWRYVLRDRLGASANRVDSNLCNGLPGGERPAYASCVTLVAAGTCCGAHCSSAR